MAKQPPPPPTVAPWTPGVDTSLGEDQFANPEQLDYHSDSTGDGFGDRHQSGDAEDFTNDMVQHQPPDRLGFSSGSRPAENYEPRQEPGVQSNHVPEGRQAYDSHQGFGRNQTYPAQPGMIVRDHQPQQAPGAPAPILDADPARGCSQPQPHRGARAPLANSSGEGPRLRTKDKKPPNSGARRKLFDLTNGLVNLGESALDQEMADLITRIRQSPGKQGYKIAVLTLKGGVGKTTVTAALAATLAPEVEAPTIAIDANPQTGTMSLRVARKNPADIRDLLADPELVENTGHGLRARPGGSYTDAAYYTGKSTSRFEVLAGPSEVASAGRMTREDYKVALEVLSKYYGIVLTDCGTDLNHDVTLAALEEADAVIIVTDPETGAIKLANDAFTFLYNYPADRRGHPIKDPETGQDVAMFRHLVARAVTVINHRDAERRRGAAYDLEDLRVVFGRLGRDVHILPHDPHLAVGADIEVRCLRRKTKLELLRLAAKIADDFPAAAGRHKRGER